MYPRKITQRFPRSPRSRVALALGEQILQVEVKIEKNAKYTVFYASSYTAESEVYFFDSEQALRDYLVPDGEGSLLQFLAENLVYDELKITTRKDIDDNEAEIEPMVLEYYESFRKAPIEDLMRWAVQSGKADYNRFVQAIRESNSGIICIIDRDNNLRYY